jgi:hypothetical protein
MKKYVLLISGLLITVAVNAQVKFGIKGGLDLSNITKTDDPNFNTDYKTGFNAGLTIEVPILSPLSIAPEILYAQKGYKAHTTLGDYTQTTNFIDIPILAKIKLAEGFNVVIGPQVSFLMSTNNTFSNGFSTTVQKQYDDDADNFRKSLIAGVAGISLDLGKSTDLHFRYALDLQKNNENGTSQTPQYRNQVFQVGIGFKMY